MFFRRPDWSLPLTSLVSLIISTIQQIQQLYITKYIFLIRNGVNLEHLSVTVKRYNSPIRSDHAITPNILVSYHIFINKALKDYICDNLGFAAHGVN